MRTTLSLSALLLATAAPAALAQPAPDGDADAADARNEDVIVVTSVRRTATPISNVTRAVTVVSADDLEIQSLLGERAAGDVLAQTVPGFSPSTEALTNFGQQLRGRNFQTLIDGVPQDTSLRNGQRSLQSIDIDAVEQIEVIRGGTAIYGFGADGGLINYITKTPDAGERETIFRIGASGSTEHPDDSLEWNTHLQTGGREGAVDYLVSGTFVNRNGTFDADGNRRLPDPVGAQGGLDESDEYNLFGKLGFRIDPRQRIEASVNVFSLRQDADFGRRLSTDTGELFLPPFRPEIPLPGDTQDADPGNEAATANLVYTHDDVLGSSVNVQGFYQDIETIFTLFPGFPQTLIESEKFGLRTTVNTPIEAGGLDAELAWGVDYLADETGQREIVGGESARGDQDAIAAFAQLEVPLGERGVLTGGVRHEDVTIDVTEVSPTGELEGSETLFNISASAFLTEEITLFGGFSQAFSPGDILRVITDGTFATVDEVELEFQRTDNYEIGVRGRFDNWTASLVAFRSESDNGLSFDSDLNILTRPEEIEGIEAALSVNPTDMVEIGGTVSVIDGEVDVDGDGTLDEDLPTTRIAPTKVTAYVEITPTARWRVRAQGLYSGEQSNNSTAFGGGNEIDDYAVLDVLASYDTGRGVVSAGVSNLFNNAYLPVLNQAYNFQFANVQAPGRRVSLSYRVAF